MADVSIQILRNGPYIVTGGVNVIDSNGKKVETAEKFALCRCGASSKKPFCDGTHSRIGFQAAEAAVPESKE